MPQFGFTIIDDATSPFHENMELPGIEAARALALRTSGEIIRDLNFETLEHGNDWAMHITDEAGRELLVLRFSTATSPLN